MDTTVSLDDCNTPASTTHSCLEFSEHFWAQDKKALDILLSRLGRSRSICEAAATVFKQRAQIEEEYAQKLMQLSQITLCDDHDSSFVDVFRQVPAAAEAAAETHLKLAQDIREHLETPLAVLLREQQNKHEVVVDNVGYAYELLNQHMENLERTRQAYKSEQNNDTQGEQTKSVETHVVQDSQHLSILQQEYKLAHQTLETSTKNWIQNWKSSCQTFQDLEESRLNHFLRAFWTYANISTTTCTTDEQSYDNIRRALENADVRKDVEDFIREHGTGDHPPEIPPLELPLVVRQEEYKNGVTSNEVRLLNATDEELRSVHEQLQRFPTKNGEYSVTDTGKRLLLTSPLHTQPLASGPSVTNTSAATLPTGTGPSPSIPPTFDTNDSHSEPFYKALPTLPVQSSLITGALQSSSTQGLTANQTEPSHNINEKTAVEEDENMVPRSVSEILNSPNTPLAMDSLVSEKNTQDSVTIPRTRPPPISTIRPPTWHMGESRSPASPNKPTQTERTRSEIHEKKKKKLFKYLPLPTFAFMKKGNKRELNSSFDFRRHTPNPQSRRRSDDVGTSPPLYTAPPDLQIPARLQLTDGTPIMEYAEANWNYTAQIVQEITFCKNDIFAVIKKNEDGWWLAEMIYGSRPRARGLVPGNFMKAL